MCGIDAHGCIGGMCICVRMCPGKRGTDLEAFELDALAHICMQTDTCMHVHVHACMYACDLEAFELDALAHSQAACQSNDENRGSAQMMRSSGMHVCIRVRAGNA